MQVLEEGARQQHDSAQHHVGPGVDVACREGSDEEVPTQDDVKDAGHQQLNQLGCVDNFAAKLASEAFHGHVLKRNYVEIIQLLC